MLSGGNVGVAVGSKVKVTERVDGANRTLTVEVLAKA